MSVFEFLKTGKVSNTILILIFIISSVLLFSDEQFVERMQLIEFKKDYGKYFGISFIISGSFISILIFSWLVRRVRNKYYGQKYKKSILLKLRDLDFKEQSIIREFVFGSSSCAMPLTNPTVAGLLDKGIIYQVGNHGDMKYGEICFNYALTKIAKQHLTNKIIGLNNLVGNELSQTDKDFLENNRPDFIRKRIGF